MFRYKLRTLLIVLALGPPMLALLVWMNSPSQLERDRQNYQDMLQFGRDLAYQIKDVDRPTFNEWMGTLSSADWQLFHATHDCLSLAFRALPDAGFTPDVDGYLALLSVELPDGQQLDADSLARWHKAIGFRMILVSLPRGRAIEVYRENGTVKAIRMPLGNAEKMMHLQVLENGTYAEYAAEHR